MNAVGEPTAGNLPTALTSLVGRAFELRQLARALPGARLLTLAGTGGSGKTRLALALAEASRPQYPGGAWWADLASVSADEQVAGAVAAALGVPQSPGEAPGAAIARHLRPHATLVVFDNCEQVVAGCAELIDGLLRSAPGLVVVATSREVIGVAGEVVFRVAGLGLPGPGGEGRDGDAVDLFVERARAVAPDFRLGPASGVTVARLCRQLDGLPLAIELAAARVSALGVADIAARLERDGAMLRHPSRTAPERHRTLDATLEWSHRLLTQPEQIQFRRLSVFRGSFSLAAAEAVTAGGPIDAAGVADLMAALVSKSLVSVIDGERQYRYQMLETIRHNAERRLAGSGELTAVHAAHSAFYLGLAEQAHAGLDGADPGPSLERLELEHANLRAVLRRVLPGEPEQGARLAALLWPFWHLRGYYQEARLWLERAAVAASTQPVPRDVHAAALSGAGALAFLQCDYPAAVERLSKARALYEEAGDRAGLALTLQRLGSIAREEARYADARRLHGESLALWAELGDQAGVATARNFIGFSAWLSGDAAQAVRLCGRALAVFRAEGRQQDIASALLSLGVATYLNGDPDEGAALLLECLDITMRLGFAEVAAWALHELAVITAGDDLATAADMLGESLATHRRLGDRWRMASVTETIAVVVAAPAEPPLAVTLAGAADALRQALGTPVPPAERRALDGCLARLRPALGPRAFDSAWRRGAAMTVDEMADAAIRATTTLAAQAAQAACDAGQPAGLGLTERELAVLGLLRDGLTNREIGARLHISVGTAGVHVSNILRKLGVTSRVQAATIAQRLGVAPPGPPG